MAADARFRRMLRWAWAAPCSLLGLAVAMPLLVAGGRARLVQGVLEVAPQRPSPRLARLPFAAITLGHVVLGIGHDELARLRVHEHAHVAQYERWGALFLLAYPLAGAWAWWRGGCPYRDNCFEVQARAAEESP